VDADRVERRRVVAEEHRVVVGVRDDDEPAKNGA
jgi:hypothetical protein